MPVGAPEPHDIFTDNHRRGDLDEWNRTALSSRHRSSGSTIVSKNSPMMPFPLQVILQILGLPEEDYGRMLTLTQQLFGGQDPDLQRYVIIATAGHDTTSSAMAGGMHALIEHPDQLKSLRDAEPAAINNAVEEMIRWTAPVRHFMRTATATSAWVPSWHVTNSADCSRRFCRRSRTSRSPVK